MFEQDPYLLAVIALALLFGGFVKGVVAIGLPIVSIGLLSSVTDARLALGVIMFPILLTNLWQMLHARRPLEIVRRFWPLMKSSFAASVRTLAAFWMTMSSLGSLRRQRKKPRR